MKHLQTIQFEQMLNGEPICLMRHYAGCCRTACNKALAYKFSDPKIANWPPWRVALTWLNDTPRNITIS